MKIFDRNRNPIIDGMVRNNKLPDENKVRTFLDQFVVLPGTAPYSKSMPSVGKLITDDLRKPPGNPKGFYSYHKPGKWPVNVERAWIAESFGCGLPNCPKPQWQHLQEGSPIHELTQHEAHLPEDFKKRLRQSKRGFHYRRTDRASRGRRFDIVRQMNEIFEGYHDRQLREFHTALRDNGYIKVRSDPELEQEILTRRAQYPGWKTYLLLGEDSEEYFGNIYQTYRWNNTHLISATHQHKGLEDWESAVFAECQVRASHEFHFHYHPQRIPRHWRVCYASIMKFCLEVDKRIEENKEIRGKPSLSMVRFSNLE